VFERHCCAISWEVAGRQTGGNALFQVLVFVRQYLEQDPEAEPIKDLARTHWFPYRHLAKNERHIDTVTRGELTYVPRPDLSTVQYQTRQNLRFPTGKPNLATNTVAGYHLLVRHEASLYLRHNFPLIAFPKLRVV